MNETLFNENNWFLKKYLFSSVLHLTNNDYNVFYSVSNWSHFTMHLWNIYISVFSFCRLETGVRLRAAISGIVGNNSNYLVFYCVLHFYAYLGKKVLYGRKQSQSNDKDQSICYNGFYVIYCRLFFIR